MATTPADAEEAKRLTRAMLDVLLTSPSPTVAISSIAGTLGATLEGLYPDVPTRERVLLIMIEGVREFWREGERLDRLTPAALAFETLDTTTGGKH